MLLERIQIQSFKCDIWLIEEGSYSLFVLLDDDNAEYLILIKWHDTKSKQLLLK
jgi:hypothetical protein